MKKNILWVITVMTLMTGCAGRGQAGKDQEEVEVDDSASIALEETQDTVPQPVFASLLFDKSIIVYYWTDYQEPLTTQINPENYEDCHKEWERLERFRRNASAYTYLILEDGTTAKVTFREEHLLDPDGKPIEAGVIHHCPGIPNSGASYDLVEATNKLPEWGNGVIVTDDFLSNHRQLTLSKAPDLWDGCEPLPADIVKQLEKKYQMKAETTKLLRRIDNRYTYGTVQFKGEWKNAPKNKDYPDRRQCLAVNVLADGQKLYVNEEAGYYESEDYYGWNADDGGVYSGCPLIAAFEGNDGLTLYYYHPACESHNVGVFTLQGDRLMTTVSECFQSLVDEELPVWKKDIAEMQRIYVNEEPEKRSGVKFSKWAHVGIDYNNEWIWVAAEDESTAGALFIRDNDRFQLVTALDKDNQASRGMKGEVSYLCIEGPEGGSLWFKQIFTYRKGKQVDFFSCILDDGEMDSCALNGTEISPMEGEAFLQALPQLKALSDFALFRTIE